jgi:chemotaxis signal transduction protein
LDSQSFLLFSLGKETFGLPALLVRAVLDKEALVPLPLAPPFVLGAANVKGRVVCIIDAAALLLKEPPSERPFWLVVDLPDGQLGLAVPGVRQSPPGATIERENVSDAAPLPAVEYGARMDGEFFRVLSLRALYDDLMSRMDGDR